MAVNSLSADQFRVSSLLERIESAKIAVDDWLSRDVWRPTDTPALTAIRDYADKLPSQLIHALELEAVRIDAYLEVALNVSKETIIKDGLPDPIDLNEVELDIRVLESLSSAYPNDLLRDDLIEILKEEGNPNLGIVSILLDRMIDQEMLGIAFRMALSIGFLGYSHFHYPNPYDVFALTLRKIFISGNSQLKRYFISNREIIEIISAQSDLTSFLFRFGVLTPKTQIELLYDIIDTSGPEVLRQFLKYSVIDPSLNKSGPLQRAIKNGKTSLVAILLADGRSRVADVPRKILRIASENGYDEIVAMVRGHTGGRRTRKMGRRTIRGVKRLKH